MSGSFLPLFRVSLPAAVLGLAAGGLTACQVLGGAPATAPTSAPSGSLRAEYKVAPPWTDAERASARQAVLQGLTATTPPAFNELLVRFEPIIGRQELTTNAFLSLYSQRHPIEGGAVGERVEVHQSWLRAGPSAEIVDGELIVRFETTRSMGPAELNIGFDLQGPRYAETVYRHSVREARGRRRLHELRYPLVKTIAEKYDVTGARDRGRGAIAFRIQQPDRTRGRVGVEDSRVAFRCKSPCDDASTFVRLPTVILGPFVDQVTARTATISFETDALTHGAIQIKDPAGGVRTVRSAFVGRRHEVLVDGLEPSTMYRYLVLGVDGRSEVVDGPDGTFRTAPAGPAPFRFAVMSDSRSAVGGGERDYGGVNRNVLERLMQQAAQRDAALVVFAGDLIDGYVTAPGEYRRQLRAWMSSVQPFHRHLPIYEVMGNHEMLGDAWSEGWMIDRAGELNSETLFAEAVVNPLNGPPPEPGRPTYRETVYSFDYGAAHFAVVNSNHGVRNRFDRDDHPGLPRGAREGELSDAQLEWLAQDLAAAKAAGQEHLFVFTHEPAFPNGGHVKDAMYYNGKIPEVLAKRDRFWGLLVKHGAVAAFFGDEHNYSRTKIGPEVDAKYSRPVWNVITGGAGAPYYARETNVPWAGAVEAFRPDHHLVIVTVDGGTVTLEAINLRGEVIDRATLKGP